MGRSSSDGHQGGSGWRLRLPSWSDMSALSCQRRANGSYCPRSYSFPPGRRLFLNPQGPCHALVTPGTGVLPGRMQRWATQGCGRAPWVAPALWASAGLGAPERRPPGPRPPAGLEPGPRAGDRSRHLHTCGRPCRFPWRCPDRLPAGTPADTGGERSPPSQPGCAHV